MSRSAANSLVHVRRAITGLLVAGLLWWTVTDLIATEGSMLGRFSPAGAFPAGFRLFTSGRGVAHATVTLQRLLAGLGIAAAVGIPLGIAIGRSQRLAELTGTLFQFLRMISPLAWTPVAIVLLGVGDAPVVFLVAVAAVWPLVLNAAAGVHALDPGWLRVATSLGATRSEQLRTIVLPGVRAHLGTGLRVALGTAWIVIVPAEMLGVDSGLGYAILDARDRLSYDELMSIVLAIGLLGLLLDTITQRISHPLRRRGHASPPKPTTRTRRSSTKISVSTGSGDRDPSRWKVR